MMPKLLTRFIAVLLISCLGTDPAAAVLRTPSSASPAPTAQAAGVFSAAALAVPSTMSIQPPNPRTKSKVVQALTLGIILTGVIRGLVRKKDRKRVPVPAPPPAPEMPESKPKAFHIHFNPQRIAAEARPATTLAPRMNRPSSPKSVPPSNIGILRGLMAIFDAAHEILAITLGAEPTPPQDPKSRSTSGLPAGMSKRNSTGREMRRSMGLNATELAGMLGFPDYAGRKGGSPIERRLPVSRWEAFIDDDSPKDSIGSFSLDPESAARYSLRSHQLSSDALETLRAAFFYVHKRLGINGRKFAELAGIFPETLSEIKNGRPVTRKMFNRLMNGMSQARDSRGQVLNRKAA